jgi:hypothetical protein
MAAEEIRALKKKPGNLHWDNRKYAFEAIS